MKYSSLCWLFFLALCCACASRQLKLGLAKEGEVVEAEGAAPIVTDERAAAAGSLAEARRQAERSLFDLYVTSETQAASWEVLDQKVLSKSQDYVKRIQVVSSGREDGNFRMRIRALVSYLRLGRDLELLGLVKPAGVRGRPRVLVSLRETGIGAGKEVGRASDSMRRALVERGYVVLDLSDKMEKSHKSGADAAESIEAGRALQADVVIWGKASASLLLDSRLEGYQPFKARLDLEAVALPSKEVLGAWSQEAGAVDVSSEAAAAKSLENAGELAAGRLKSLLSERYAQRSELALAVNGLGQMAEARRLILALRGLPHVAGACLQSISGRDVRLRVFVEKTSADELAAALLRLKPYRFTVRSVEPDYNSIELEAEEGG